MNDSTIYETLNKAADLIRERGWWHDSPGSGVGVCASNAISMVTAGEFPMRRSAQDAFLDYLGAPTSDLYHIFVWNDAEGRTAEQVIETLRAAAVVVSARENTTQPVNAAVAQDA